MEGSITFRIALIATVLCSVSPPSSPAEARPPASVPALKKSPSPTGVALLKRGSEYRSTLADQLPDAARVTVFLLDDSMEGASTSMFLIRPYDAYSRILNAKMYKASEVQDLLNELKVVLKSENEFQSPPEHFPFHAIRVFNASNRVIFESSFSWKGPRAPASYSVLYPNGPGWAPIDGDALEQMFRKLAPIPTATWNAWQTWGTRDK